MSFALGSPGKLIAKKSDRLEYSIHSCADAAAANNKPKAAARMMMKRIVVSPKKSLRFRTYYNHEAVRREFFGSGASEEHVRSKLTTGAQLTVVASMMV